MNLVELQRDPAAFRAALLIDTDAGPVPFGKCMDPWQDSDFRVLDPGWIRAVRGVKAPAPPHQRAWLERPRGHSKSLDLAVMSTWALFASVRRLAGYAAAADQDQARLLRDAISKLVYVNPWLGKILDVQANRVVNLTTGSTLTIISSDVRSSWGLLADFIVVDEATHMRERDLFDSLLSTAAKRSTCMFVTITNAGIIDEWQWGLREKIRTDSTWYFSRLDGPVARWITSQVLAEQERLLPTIVVDRLWRNIWTSGLGDALSQADIDAAFNPALRPLEGAAFGWEFVGGLDLGVTRDCSAVCILGIRRGRERHGQIRLAATRIWKPRKGAKVNLQEVEAALIDLNGRFLLKALNFDPWQALHMASRLSAAGLGVLADQLRPTHMTARVPMVEIQMTAKALTEMASACLEAFHDRRLELYEDSDLRRDITRWKLEERLGGGGYKLVSPRDEYGHGDMGSAFALAVLAASTLAEKRKLVAGVMEGGRTATESAMKRMEQEFRQIARNNERMKKIAASGYDYTGLDSYRSLT
jgi:hypothetical protein